MVIDIKTVVTAVFLAIGCFLFIVASIGVMRFPDFYTRLHAAGKVDTMGQTFILLGLLFYSGFSLVGIKLVIIMAFIYIINPTATHFLTKAAYVRGLKPWVRGDRFEPYIEVEAAGDGGQPTRPRKPAGRLKR